MQEKLPKNHTLSAVDCEWKPRSSTSSGWRYLYCPGGGPWYSFHPSTTRVSRCQDSQSKARWRTLWMAIQQTSLIIHPTLFQLWYGCRFLWNIF